MDQPTLPPPITLLTYGCPNPLLKPVLRVVEALLVKYEVPPHLFIDKKPGLQCITINRCIVGRSKYD